MIDELMSTCKAKYRGYFKQLLSYIGISPIQHKTLNGSLTKLHKHHLVFFSLKHGQDMYL